MHTRVLANGTAERKKFRGVQSHTWSCLHVRREILLRRVGDSGPKKKGRGENPEKSQRIQMWKGRLEKADAVTFMGTGAKRDQVLGIEYTETQHETKPQNHASVSQLTGLFQRLERGGVQTDGI